MSVDRIINLGDDQMAVKWLLLFPNGLPGVKDPDTVALRMEGGFKLPDFGVGTYKIPYKGTEVLKTNLAPKEDHMLSNITVRLDQQWKVFDDLYTLMKMTYDLNTGTAMPDLVTRFPIIIQMLDGQDNVVKSLKYNHCKLVELGIDDLSDSGAEPLKLKLSFIYGTFEYF